MFPLSSGWHSLPPQLAIIIIIALVAKVLFKFIQRDMVQIKLSFTVALAFILVVPVVPLTVHPSNGDSHPTNPT